LAFLASKIFYLRHPSPGLAQEHLGEIGSRENFDFMVGCSKKVHSAVDGVVVEAGSCRIGLDFWQFGRVLGLLDHGTICQ